MPDFMLKLKISLARNVDVSKRAAASVAEVLKQLLKYILMKTIKSEENKINRIKIAK